MMRCGYIILMFVLGLAVASPAVYAISLLIIGMPEDAPRRIFAGAGALEIFMAVFVGAISMEDWLPKLWSKAKAELDALKAGMRGENAP